VDKLVRRIEDSHERTMPLIIFHLGPEVNSFLGVKGSKFVGFQIDGLSPHVRPTGRV